MSALSKKRQQELLAYLATLPEQNREAVRRQIIANGGPEGEFLADGQPAGDANTEDRAGVAEAAKPRPKKKGKK